MLDLSIVLITYNRAALLRKTLESLACLPFAECELIVLNNASEDETTDIVTAALPRFQSGRLVTHPVNIGGNPNILRAYEFGSRHYKWILCDDDILDFSRVEDLIEVLNDRRAEVIRLSDVGVIPEERGTLRSIASLLHDRNSFSFYSLGFVPGVIFRSDRIGSNVQYGYMNIHTFYPQLFVLMRSFSPATPVYTTKSVIVARGPGVMSIGSEIIGHQIRSLAALPSKRARRIALGFRRGKQSLLRFLFGYSFLLLSDYRMKRKRMHMTRTWLETVRLAPSLASKLVIAVNGLTILLPIRLIARLTGKFPPVDMDEVRKRGAF